MKIFHLSDTHLGFSEYAKIDPVTGINQREQDFYRAWQQTINAILESGPDVVVHAGDLFHTPRPSNRAIHTALESIQQISDAGIPLVIVAGNHETPRIKTTGSIFESISLFDNVYAAFSGRYQKFTIGECSFHCLPHCSLTEELERAIGEIKPDARKKNILVAHGAWSGKQLYGMGEFNEQRLPDLEVTLNATFDYIALGHYHRQVDIKPHVCYSGSTERTSLNEHNTQCGYLIFDLNTGKKEYRTIPVRPMIKFPPLNCQNMNSPAIYDHLQEKATDEIEGAIVQITLENISQETFVKLDSRKIDDIFKDCFHLEKILFRQVGDTGEAQTSTHIDSLPVEFERFLDKIDLKEMQKKRLAQLGNHYLGEAAQ